MLVFSLLLGGCWGLDVTTAIARDFPLHLIQIAQDSGQYPVAPSQAAVIAKESVPGSKVLNVKLLPSGVYAVTLKVGGSVTRVMVDATSGAVT